MKKSSPLRVAFFFTTLELGGTERQTLNLIEHLDRKRVKPIVYAIRGGALQEQLAKLGVPVRVLAESGIGASRAAFRVRTWLHEDSIDILHALLWHTNLLARAACLGTPVKCINSIRWAERKPRDIIDYATRGSVDWWIANSVHGARLARLSQRKTTIINNGIDTRLLKTPLTAWKPVPKTVTMIAQFRREKRYDTFIRAAVLLPDWTFQCVGDGENLEAMRHLADSLGVRNVRFLGKRSDVNVILEHSSVAVLLSTSEGSPNTALEALALGVPFIGSDIPAHRELLADGRGDLVSGDDPKPLVETLRHHKKYTIKQVLNRRRRAKEYVLKGYAIPHMVEETTKIYERLSRRRA